MRFKNLELFPLDYFPKNVQHIVSGLDVAQTSFIGSTTVPGVSATAEDGVDTFLFAPSVYFGIRDYGDVPGLQSGYPSVDFHGGTGNDLLWGGNSDDTLKGNAGDDAIFGNGGDDIIFGGLGADIIETGAGADDIRFDVEDSQIGSADHVTDFNAAEDDFYLMTYDKDNWDYDYGSRLPTDITETSGAAGTQQAVTDLAVFSGMTADDDDSGPEVSVIEVTGGALAGTDWLAVDFDDDGIADSLVEITGYTGEITIDSFADYWTDQIPV